MTDKQKKEKTKCVYCREPLEDNNIHWGVIISPNWKRSGYRSPKRPYCKDKPCHDCDQMAHEG